MVWRALEDFGILCEASQNSWRRLLGLLLWGVLVCFGMFLGAVLEAYGALGCSHELVGPWPLEPAGPASSWGPGLLNAQAPRARGPRLEPPRPHELISGIQCGI